MYRWIQECEHFFECTFMVIGSKSFHLFLIVANRVLEFSSGSLHNIRSDNGTPIEV